MPPRLVPWRPTFAANCSLLKDNAKERETPPHKRVASSRIYTWPFLAGTVSLQRDKPVASIRVLTVSIASRAVIVCGSLQPQVHCK